MNQIYTITLITIILYSGCKKDDSSIGPEDEGKKLAAVTTTEVSIITSTSAKTGGTVTNNGGALVTARGVCWGTSDNPVLTGNKTMDGEGNGSFISNMTGLTQGTKYYVRAYATNSVGTSYGSTLSFTSSSINPTLETVAISNITSSTATSGGNINSDGGSAVIARGVCWSTNEYPVVTGNKTMDGAGSGGFTSNITGLSDETKYYVRAYATNSAGTSYGLQLSFTTLKTPITYDTLTYNGFTYTTVTIGSQEWTVENLRATTYNDGTAISKVIDRAAWLNLTTGAYCAFENNEGNVTTYGYLYNWYSVNSGKLGPITGGWRVPTKADWVELTNFVGENWEKKLKAKFGWIYAKGSDEFGFKGLPGGGRFDGDFKDLGAMATWWSSTEQDLDHAVRCYLFNYFTEGGINGFSKKNGFSIRLVRDK